MEVMRGLTGVLVIGLTNYTTTVERQREYGILKALGIKNRDLLQIAFWQSILIALSGFGIADGLTIVVVRGLQYVVHFPIAILYDAGSVAPHFRFGYSDGYRSRSTSRKENLKDRSCNCIQVNRILPRY